MKPLAWYVHPEPIRWPKNGQKTACQSDGGGAALLSDRPHLPRKEETTHSAPRSREAQLRVEPPTLCARYRAGPGEVVPADRHCVMECVSWRDDKLV